MEYPNCGYITKMTGYPNCFGYERDSQNDVSFERLRRSHFAYWAVGFALDRLVTKRHFAYLQVFGFATPHPKVALHDPFANPPTVR